MIGCYLLIVTHNVHILQAYLNDNCFYTLSLYDVLSCSHSYKENERRKGAYFVNSQEFDIRQSPKFELKLYFKLLHRTECKLQRIFLQLNVNASWLVPP